MESWSWMELLKLRYHNGLKCLVIYSFIFLVFEAWGETPRFSIFGDCKVSKDYQYLSKDQVSKISSSLPNPLDESIVRRFKVQCAGEDSYAYMLNDRVRTHPQTLLIWTKQKAIKDLEILNFSEPPRYLPPKRWLTKLKGKSQESVSKLDALSGATLTRQSTLKLAKKALILDASL